MASRRRIPFKIGRSPSSANRPDVPPLAGRPALVKCASRLIKSAAEHLGLDAEAARVAGQTATLGSGDKTIFILPMGPGEGSLLSLVLCVQTNVPVETGAWAANAVEVLKHAPAVLHAFSASIGSTPHGCWSVYRSVYVAPDGGAALAAYLRETVQLTDFVFLDRSNVNH